MKQIALLFSLWFCAFTVQASSGAALLSSAAIGAEWMKEFSSGTLKIDKIELLEPNLIPPHVFAAITQPYLGKELTPADLQNVQRALSRFYIDSGYVSSGVIIPNQRIIDGTVKMRAIHARVEKVDVTGISADEAGAIHAQIARGLSVPVNYVHLQRALTLLRQSPVIDNVQAQLLPGAVLGENILKVHVKPTNRLNVVLQAGNSQSPSIGGERVGVSTQYRGGISPRHTVSLDAGLTRGLKDVAASYAIPLGNSGALIRASGSYADFTVVEAPLDKADVESQSWVANGSLALPVYKSLGWDAQLYAGMDYKRSRSTIFGLSGISGEDPETRLSVGFAGVSVVKHGSRAVVAVSGGVRHGLNVLDATVRDDSTADGLFTSYQYQAYLSTRLIGASSWLVRAIGQYSADALLPMEKFAVGGMYSVRGFRENYLVRENGGALSSEIRIPLLTSKFMLAPFVDVGRSWYAQSSSSDDFSAARVIASAGVGIIADPFKRLHGEIFWGKRFLVRPDVVDDSQNDWQDKGFHARITYDVY